jgi:hypothetical protein
MSSTCFELKGSSSGRRLYKQVCYSVFHMDLYKQSCRLKSVFEHTDACKTHCTILVDTTVFQKMNNWVRNMWKTTYKLKIIILIEKMCIFWCISYNYITMHDERNVKLNKLVNKSNLVHNLFLVY